MNTELIDAQHLVNNFLEVMQAATKTGIQGSSRSGPVSQKDIPFEIQLNLSELFQPTAALPLSFNMKYRNLFNGDVSEYGNDQSSADMALVGYLARKGLTQAEADLVFRASKLYRPKWDEMRGSETYGERTIGKVFKDEKVNSSQINTAPESCFIDLENYRPVYVPMGMPPRQFVGPSVGPGINLFPAKSLSALVALGASGKTSLLISIATHVAAGKSWNNQPVKQSKVAMFCVEEIQEELNRKFSAVVDDWTNEEREEATNNLLLVSLIGKDARLSNIDRGQHSGSGIAEQIIELVQSFELKDGLLILDHMQGFASGDLNVSETSTALCREANKIVEVTGAAVVFAAHISKANIKAEEVEQGFAVGSLAFENAVRQMSGMIAMSEAEAKKYGLVDSRKNYIWLGMPKNSYGASSGGMWLEKVHVEKYHTVVMRPADLALPVPAEIKTANQKIADRLIDHLKKDIWVTRNKLDASAGVDGPFKASKNRLRDVLSGLIDSGDIKLHEVTDAEREEYGVPKQVKTVLRVKPAG